MTGIKKFISTTILLLLLSCGVTFADSFADPPPIPTKDELVELKGYQIFVVDGSTAERINEECDCDILINDKEGIILLLRLKPRTHF